MCCTVWELASDDALHDSIKGGEPIMQCVVEGLSGKAVQVGSEEDVGTGTFSDSSHRNQTGPGILPPSTSVVVGVTIARPGVWYDECGGRVYCHLAMLHAPALVMRIVESEGLKGCLDSFLAVDYLWGCATSPVVQLVGSSGSKSGSKLLATWTAIVAFGCGGGVTVTSQSYLACDMRPNHSGIVLSAEARHVSNADCRVGGGGLACPLGPVAAVGGGCGAPCCVWWKIP